ncbi:PucR family transcriptional regulator [Streptomyces sp. CB01580]|uniref:PucR family transcriptional regulator n=1 Tax=Streptomyces sp. CB01580 TaxID=1703933 RepID=UPI0013013729|nr:PucR family transcriptional regulator [Streptomyces sp. CB01580]
MITLKDVLALPGLGLGLIDGDGAGGGTTDALGREVRWAHVSELEDPTPWLLGGELLLSTGLNRFEDAAQTFAYCERLTRVGVAALGVSTGASLPHPELPAVLLAGCAAAGLALVHVPENTGLQSIIQAVSDALNAEHTEPMRRALLAQRNLADAAAQVKGPDAVLAGMAETSGMHSVLFDGEMRVVAECGSAALDLAEVRRTVRARLLSSSPWSVAMDVGEWTMTIVPVLASGTMRGILVVAKPGAWTEYDRALRSMAHSLLAVLLELRYRAGQRRWATRAQAFDALLDGTGEASEVEERLVRAELGWVTRVQVITTAAMENPGRRAAFVAGLQELAADVLVRSAGGTTQLGLLDPDDGVESRAEALAAECGIARAGMSRPVHRAEGHVALRQAERAYHSADTRGVPFVVLERFGGYRALLSLGSGADRQEYAHQVLSPLMTPEARGTDLYGALRAYVRSAGNTEVAAAHLGVHRHTARARLRRVAELTGLDPTRALDLFELWLAVEIRELFEEREAADG